MFRIIHIFEGMKILWIFFFFFFFWGGGGGSRQNWTSLRGLFYVIFWAFLKVNVQNENIFAWLKFQIRFWVLDIPIFFGGKR